MASAPLELEVKLIIMSSHLGAGLLITEPSFQSVQEVTSLRLTEYFTLVMCVMAFGYFLC